MTSLVVKAFRNKEGFNVSSSMTKEISAADEDHVMQSKVQLKLSINHLVNRQQINQQLSG